MGKLSSIISRLPNLDRSAIKNISRRLFTRSTSPYSSSWMGDLEPLEQKIMLSGDPLGSVFSRFNGVLNNPTETEVIHVSLTPGDFTLNRLGLVNVGMRVQAKDGSPLDPAAVQVNNSNGQPVALRLANPDLDGHSSLGLAELPLGDYDVTVAGQRGTSGAFVLDLFLIGDADGDRDVDGADTVLVRGSFGKLKGQPGYIPEADADLDGRITAFDVTQHIRNILARTTRNPDENRPPDITSSPVTTATEGSPYQYDVDAIDPDEGDVLTYSLDTKPDGMTIDPVTGLIQWTPVPGSGQVGQHGVTVRVTDNGGLFDTQDFEIEVLPLGDLTIDGLDGHSLVFEGQAMTVTGLITATVTNNGPGDINAPFQVSFFEDLNLNGLFDLGSDNVVGSTLVTTPLLAGQSVTITAPLNGTVQFSGTVIWGFVDSQGVIAEKNEDNNLSRSGLDCIFVPPVGQFNPVIEWSWTGNSVLPDSLNVMMTPAIIDLNGDGVPDIVFGSTASRGGGLVEVGVLRALSGDDGRELFTVTDPTLAISTTASVDVGDIDLDGKPEIIASDATGARLIAFEHDGAFKWLSPNLESIFWGAPSLADLDGDGTPEIIVGRQVLNNDSTVRWTGTGGRGDAGGVGPLSFVADIDLDGSPEVVAGNTAYKADGQILWQAPVPDGHGAIGNFDEDSYPEIVLVTGGTIRLLEHDGSVKWGPVSIPGGGTGGPPTVADYDNDGQAEIGVAGATRYTVFETDGSVKWAAVTQDGSSNRTGSSVFDFDGDGSAEVVYRDELFLRIYRGTDGTVLFETPMSSCTWHEYVNVADVDADGNAEIIAVANDNCGFGPQRGVFVFGDLNDTWVPTRQIWNQHTYHITNVNDDGTIPAVEANSWLTSNTYRTQALPEGSGGALAAPDLTASYVSFSVAGADMTLKARIGNGGAILVGAGVHVAFYDADPRQGGALVGVTQTTKRLVPGDFEDVSLTVPVGSVRDLWVVADDDGTGHGRVNECDEENNFYHPGISLPEETDAPVVEAGLANDTGRSDRDGITFDPTITGTVTDASVVTGFRAMLDGGPLVEVLSKLTGVSFTLTPVDLEAVNGGPVADGDHTLSLQAEDEFGNVSSFFDVAFTLDTAAPLAPGRPDLRTGSDSGSSHVDNITNDNTPTVRVNAEANSLVRLLVDGTEQGQDIVSGLLDFTVGLLVDGLHRFKATAEDIAGNVSGPSLTLNVTIDTVAPAIPVFDLDPASDTAPLGDHQTTLEEVTLRGTTDPNTAVKLVQTGGMTVSDASGVFLFTAVALTLGDNEFTVEAADLAGNSSSFSRPITRVDTTNATPFFVSTPVTTVDEDAPYVYNITASDPDLDAKTEGLAIVTADNQYGLYMGHADGSGLVLIGQSDTSESAPDRPHYWPIPESFKFTPRAGDYLYVLAWDHSPSANTQMWLGAFMLPDGTTLLSNTTDWEYYVAADRSNPGGVFGSSVGTLPSINTVIEDISKAHWSTPAVSQPQGSFPWGTIPGISTAASFVWHDTFAASSSSDDHYVIFRTKNPVQPAPAPGDLTITAPVLPTWLTLADHGDGTATLLGTPTNDEVGEHEVVLQVVDGEGAVGTQSFKVTVANVNDQPVIGDQSFNIAENSPNGTVVGTVVASDVDLGDVLKFSIIGGTGAGAFAIDNDSGQVTVADNSLLNFEANPSFTLAVRVTDVDGMTDDATVTANLSDVNEPPVVDNPLAEVTVDEDAVDTVFDLSGVFSDPDTGDGLTLTVVGNDNDTLVTTSLAGTMLTLGYQLNQNGVANLTIRATDTQGLFVEDSFQVTVTPVNDAPEASGASVVTNEDTPVDVDLLPLVSDVETLGLGLTFTVGAGVSGTVSLLPDGHTARFTSLPEDFNGSARFAYSVTDTGDGSSPAITVGPVTIDVTVNAVNDAPVNSVPGSQNINQDTTLVFSSGNGNLISISDLDAATNPLQVTLTATNGTLSLAGVDGLTFSDGNGTSDAAMTFTGSISAIHTALNGMNFTPSSGFTGAARLQITTNDQGNTGSGGPLSDSDIVAINVEGGINHDPLITSSPVTSFNIPGSNSPKQGDFDVDRLYYDLASGQIVGQTIHFTVPSLGVGVGETIGFSSAGQWGLPFAIGPESVVLLSNENGGTNNRFTWGTPFTIPGIPSPFTNSYVQFDGRTFDADPSGLMNLGLMNYRNGEIFLATGFNGDFPLTIELEIAAGTTRHATFRFNFNILNTRNDPFLTPEQNADILRFSTAGVTNDTFDFNGVRYTLRLIGFSTDGGNTIVSEFRSPEGATSQASLYARLESLPITEIDLVATDNSGVFVNLTEPLSGVNAGDVVAFDMQFTGDGTSHAFDLKVVDTTNGTILGSIPVSINNKYFYQVLASDQDSDPLTFSLTAAPSDAGIDLDTGLLTWLVTQTGQFDFKVRVEDGQGGFDEQTFTVTVIAAETGSPQILASLANDTGRSNSDRITSDLTITGTVNDASLITAFRASLDDRSVVNVLSKLLSGSFTLTPTDLEAINGSLVADGNHTLSLQAEDEFGNVSSFFDVTFTLDTTAPAAPTQPDLLAASDSGASDSDDLTNDNTPTIRTDAEPNSLVRLFIDGVEADQAIAASPVEFTPAPGSALSGGQRTVTATAEDVAGNVSEESSALMVTIDTAAPTSPVFALDPASDTAPIGDHQTTLDSVTLAGLTDPDTAVRLVQTSDTTVSDGSGVFLFAGVAVVLGENEFTVEATDVAGNRSSFGRTITRIASPEEDIQAPVVDLQVDSHDVATGQIITLTVVASDNVGIASKELKINGTVIALDPDGKATFTSATPGAFQAVATASDAAGNSRQDTEQLFFFTAGDTTPPTVAITSPADNAALTSITEVRGTVSDDTELLLYTLEIAPSNSNVFTEIGRGNAKVNDGRLGQIDVTLLPNDTYTLKLTAIDASGNTNSVEQVFRIEGNQKVGNFKLSFVDLTIPVAGIPITISRTYDSLNGNRQGDFGFGWSLDLTSQLKLRTNGVQGTGWQVNRSVGFFPTYTLVPQREHTVTVVLPNGRTEVFDLRPNPSSPAIIPLEFTTAAYAARPGTRGSLRPLGDTDLIILGSITGGSVEFVTFDFETYNPTTFEYTAADGTVYVLDKQLGLQSIRDRNGNTISISPSGVTSSAGVGVTFTRDAQGRIMGVSDLDPTTDDIVYAYDVHGDLVSVSDREGNTTRFSYDKKVPHYLAQIIDPLGRTGARSEYDDQGRLVKIIDANGKETILDHNLDSNTETVTDALGTVTLFQYDARGNVIREEVIGADPLRLILRTYDSQDNVLTQTIVRGTGPDSVTGETDDQKTTFTYDSNGNQLTERMTLEDGTTIESVNTYDANSNLLTTSVTLADGTKIETVNTYDGSGNLKTSRDPEGNVTTYGYDAVGNLTSIEDPLHRVTTFNYDSRGNLLSTTDLAGVTRSFTYDANGNQTSSSFTWVNPNDPADTRDVTTQTFYDANGQVVRAVDALGNETRTDYDALGNVIRTTDALGNITVNVYDNRGQRIETQFPDGTLTRSVYDDLGRVIYTVDRYHPTLPQGPPNGTHIVYDKVGRVIKTERLDDVVIGVVTLPDGSKFSVLASVAALISMASTKYDEAGRVIESTGPDGQTTRFEYDNADRQIAVVDPLGSRTTFEYDLAGRQTAVVDALLHRTQFEYDKNGRLIKTIFNDGSFTTTTYDELGRRTTETDQTGKTRQFRYDSPLGLLTEVTLPAVQDPENSDVLTEPRYVYEYDQYGNQTLIRDPASGGGRETTFTYDFLNRQVSRTLPMGETETFEYDSFGRLHRQVDFKSQVTQYVYDSLGRQTEKRLFNSVTDADADLPAIVITTTYDELGRQKTVNDPRRGLTQYTYDIEGRITRIDSPEGVINYEYDPATGRQTRVFTDFTDVGYTYDELGRLKTVTENMINGVAVAAQVTTYTYTAVGTRETVTLPNGVVTAYVYDDLNRLTSVTTRGPPASGSPLLASYEYTLREDGLRTSVLETRREADDTLSQVRVNYTYDALNRLTREESVVLAGTLPDRSFTTDYVYNLVGNRLSKTTAPGSGDGETITSTYNDNDQLLQEVAVKAGVTTTTTYAYNTNGSLIEKRVNGDLTAQYSYNLENRLESVTTFSTNTSGQSVVTTATYLYDENGIRVRAETTVSVDGGTPTVTVQVFLIDPLNRTGYAQVLEEKDGSTSGGGNPVKTYIIGDDVLYQVAGTSGGGGGTALFFGYDGHGSTRFLTNAAAAIFERYNYDAYGNAIGFDPATAATVLLYTGEQFDHNAQQYYLRARYYNPMNGQFNQIDQFSGDKESPQSLSKYSYAHLDPVNGVDPSGNFTLVEVASLASIRITLGVLDVAPTILKGLAILSVIQGILRPGVESRNRAIQFIGDGYLEKGFKELDRANRFFNIASGPGIQFVRQFGQLVDWAFLAIGLTQAVRNESKSVLTVSEKLSIRTETVVRLHIDLEKFILRADNLIIAVTNVRVQLVAYTSTTRSYSSSAIISQVKRLGIEVAELARTISDYLRNKLVDERLENAAFGSDDN